MASRPKSTLSGLKLKLTSFRMSTSEKVAKVVASTTTSITYTAFGTRSRELLIRQLTKVLTQVSVVTKYPIASTVSTKKELMP